MPDPKKKKIKKTTLTECAETKSQNLCDTGKEQTQRRTRIAQVANIQSDSNFAETSVQKEQTLHHWRKDLSR